MIYIIISERKASELEYAVNNRIKTGYIVNGGIAISTDGTFHQPMVHAKKLMERLAEEQNDGNSI